MPLYEYQCPKCGVFELIRKFSDEPVTLCPICGSEIQKLASAPAFHLKGTGWYVTDYAKKSSGDGKPGQGKSEEGKSDKGKSEEGKSGDDKSGESKSGDSKPGASKTSESKSGDSGKTLASDGSKGSKDSSSGAASAASKKPD